MLMLLAGVVLWESLGCLGEEAEDDEEEEDDDDEQRDDELMAVLLREPRVVGLTDMIWLLVCLWLYALCLFVFVCEFST